MAERLYGTGKAPLGGYDYTATIHDTDWVGALTEFDVNAGGIRIKYDPVKSDDRHAPILGSVASVSMLVEVGDSVIETFLEDLRLSKEGRFWLEITCNLAPTTVWRGIIITDNSWETDEGKRFTANISAVDGIALLKNEPYYTPGSPPTLLTGTNKVTRHITRCITKLAHQSLWGASDPILETSTDWWSDAMTAGGANDALHLVYVDNAAFYDYHTKGGVDKDVLSCYDVLVNILHSFGCRMYQYGGVFRVEQIDYRANHTYEYRRYDKSANFLSNSTRTGVNTIDQTVTGAKLSYVTYDYIPQLSKAQVTYEAKLRRNFWGNILLSEGVTYNFNQEISANSGLATFRIRGLFFVNIKNNTYSGNPQDIIFAEMQLSLKVGSNYLKRNGTYSNFSWHPDAPSWSASSSDHCTIVSSGQQVTPAGLSQSYVIPFDIITAALPSDGSSNFASATLFQLTRNNNQTVTESEFTISWTAGSMWMEVYDAGTPDVQEDEILYESTNPDGGSDMWEATIRIGGGSANYAGRLMNSSNTSWALWGRGVGARDKTIGAVLADVVVNGQLRGIKRMSGQIRGILDPTKLMSTSDGIDWLPMALDWSLTESTISGTWFEVDYGSAAVSATPVKVKYIPSTSGGHPIFDPPTTGGFTGNGNAEFSNNSPATVLGPLIWNTLDTPITDGDTITSIALSTPSSGNDFLVGDEVSLAHPTNGKYQIFTVSTAPTAGATSLAVSSATALFDAPEGAFLVIRQKPFSFTLPTGTHVGQILYWDGSAWVVYGTNSLADGVVLTWTDAGGWAAAIPSGGTGTVTSFSAGDLSPLFTTSEATVTTTPALSFAQINQSANLIFAGPSTGAAAAPTFRALALADIANSLITYAKIQNISANNRILGNVSGAAGAITELTAAQVYTMLSLLSIAADQIVYGTGANGMASNAALKWLSATLQLQVAGNGGADFWFLGASGTAISGNIPLMGISRSASGDMYISLENTRNISNSGTTTLYLTTGGTSGSDPRILFRILGAGTGGIDLDVAFGVDNSAAGDPIRLTPRASNVGGTANVGMTWTQDAAATLVGINKDVPVYPLDVNGRARSTQLLGTGNQWTSANISFGTGAGTGASVTSIIGFGNGFKISFTTGTTPTANASIFTATYPIPFISASFPTWSARNDQAATDYNKIRVNADGATTCAFSSVGSLAASTAYIMVVNVFGY